MAGWKNIKYRQDMPPPGGYGSIPYKRNLPIRGPSGYMMFGLATAFTLAGARAYRWRAKVYAYQQEEDLQSETALMPLLEAERDRQFLRHAKEKIESEALNIVGTGIDPDFKPGIRDTYHNADRWEDPTLLSESPFSMAIRWWHTRAGINRCGP